MYMDTDNHGPSLFGFDLFHLISFHVHGLTRFSLAILPHWFWVNLAVSWEGVYLEGSIAGRGFVSGRWFKEGRPAGVKWFRFERVDGNLDVWVGDMYYILDKKPSIGKDVPQAQARA